MRTTFLFYEFLSTDSILERGRRDRYYVHGFRKIKQYKTGQCPTCNYLDFTYSCVHNKHFPTLLPPGQNLFGFFENSSHRENDGRHPRAMNHFRTRCFRPTSGFVLSRVPRPCALDENNRFAATIDDRGIVARRFGSGQNPVKVGIYTSHELFSFDPQTCDSKKDFKRTVFTRKRNFRQDEVNASRSVRRVS